MVLQFARFVPGGCVAAVHPRTQEESALVRAGSPERSANPLREIIVYSSRTVGQHRDCCQNGCATRASVSTTEDTTVPVERLREIQSTLSCGARKWSSDARCTRIRRGFQDAHRVPVRPVDRCGPIRLPTSGNRHTVTLRSCGRGYGLANAYCVRNLSRR